jgi:hypothetical protein
VKRTSREIVEVFEQPWNDSSTAKVIEPGEVIRAPFARILKTLSTKTSCTGISICYKRIFIIYLLLVILR